MRIKQRTFWAWFMAMFLLVLMGGTATAAGRLTSINITPSNSSILLGTTSQFTATGTYSDGSTKDITKMVRWSSSATAVATISNSEGMSTKGLATSVAIGETTITATQGNISGTTILIVKTLVSLTVTPSNPSIALGISQQFAATGTYSDNSTQDMTASVIWSSSNTGIADISNAPGSNGLATSVTVGTATIIATSGSISGSTTLIITPAVLVSITIPPITSSIMIGETRQFVATGTYSDNSMQDLTTLVDWFSSNIEVATISNVGGSKGLSTAVGFGSTNITAILGSISGNTTLTVAGVVNIPITGQTTSYAVGDDGNMQKGVSWPNPRFSTNADTTVTDNLTGLIWPSDGNAPGPAACSPGVIKTWQGALDYVACLNANSYLGYTDWRLPNRKELNSLSNYDQASFATWLNSQGFSNVVAYLYWSSTTLVSYPNYAWFVSMDNGGVDTYVKTISLYVWPVRAGQ